MPERNVLVVNDDALVRWALSKQLTARGIGVDVAASGSEARTRLSRGNYDMAFLDVELPDACGLDLLHEIRATYPRTRVVMLTCDPAPATKQRAFGEGASQVIEKPFDLIEIGHLVDSLLVDHVERRRFERVLCRLPLRMSLVAGGPGEEALDLQNLAGMSVDVSNGGLRLGSRYPLRPRQQVTVRVANGDDPCGRMIRSDQLAEVVWTSPRPHGVLAGLRYLADPTPGQAS